MRGGLGYRVLLLLLLPLLLLLLLLLPTPTPPTLTLGFYGLGVCGFRDFRVDAPWDVGPCGLEITEMQIDSVTHWEGYTALSGSVSHSLNRTTRSRKSIPLNSHKWQDLRQP